MLYWDDAVRKALTARWPDQGKPLNNNTRIILDGTRDAPKRVRLRFHSTDILVWTPDSKIYVCTGWSTVTTLARLSEYGDVQVYKRNHPTINGYAVNPDNGLYMHIDRCWPVPFNGNLNFHGYNNYACFDVTTGEFDIDSIDAPCVECVTDPTALRRKMTKLGKVAKLALGYAKLAGDNPFNQGHIRIEDWLRERVDIPLEEIQLSPWPYIGDRTSPRAAFTRAMNSLRWSLAKEAGFVGKVTLLKKP